MKPWGEMRARAWPGLIAIVLLLSVPVRAAEQAVPGYAGVGVFEMPALTTEEFVIVEHAKGGDLAGAATALDGLIARFPQAAHLRVARALLAAIAGDNDKAVDALLKADELGATGLGLLMKRPELARLAEDPRLADLTDRPPPEPAPASPALVQNGEAQVGPGNTVWDPALARVIARFTFPPILRTHAFVENPPPGPYADLQRLVAYGRAAGNVGDLYDNRDRGHSPLRQGRRTQLTETVYGPEARAAGIDYGLNTQILFDAPTFGNSSTAITGPLWRSLPRLALTTPGGALRLWQLYANNHIYVFPEHNDHDPVAEGGHGDLIPANTPYLLISQGSSGSDQPFLQAIQAILAAFRPEVKARLVKEKLIAPMVQQIFRRGQTGLGEDGYLGPRAHPSVFRAEDIDVAEMIRLAQALKVDEIPPVVTIRMLREASPDGSIFADGLNEILFDTPAAISRVWRGLKYARRFELGAEATDPDGRPVTYHWRVLRGDAERIAIEPLDENASRVRITLPWQEPGPVPGHPELTSPRVDIAVFADNGAQLSAPAFFSMLYPAHQVRDYAPDGRPLSVAPAPGDVYADPLIWPRRAWKDVFRYDAQGHLLGWTRTRNGTETRFTAHGLEILETDSVGRATVAGKVDYPVSQAEDGALVVTPTPTERRFRYIYAGPADRIGHPVPISGQD